MRIGLFIVLIGTGLFLPFWVFVGASFLYALRFRGYELVVLGACIDATFGVQDFSYLYTVGTAVVSVFAIYVRPHLVFYD